MKKRLTEVNNIYCTYFDKGFLLKGLALHASLIRHNPNVKLWILAFDIYTEKILIEMKLKGVTVVPLRDIEDKALLAAKKTRHTVEYYWTCTPSWILYILSREKSVETVTYVDGDLYFYSNPDDGVSEIGDKSILAVEHRFPKGREGMVLNSGRFNVAFNVFRNDDVSKKCLTRWRKQCLDWCYWKLEDGKLGDQMYLNEWPNLYGKDMVISKNVGVDVAPWNVSQYKVESKSGQVYINNDKLVCYHFHQFQIVSKNHFNRILGYTLSKNVVDYIYGPYEEEVGRQFDFVVKFDKDYKIVKTEKDKGVLLRERMAKHIGPIYWKIKNIFRW
jgi:hypothetical protein